MKRLLFVVLGSALLTGCVTSGTRYAELKPQLAPPAQDQGRVMFFREASFVGAGVQPQISLDGKVVGMSMPGAFFFVDVPAGQHACSTETEVERSLSFSLEGGEVKYIKSYITVGLMIGRTNFELTSPAEAEGMLQNLHQNTGLAPGVAPAKAETKVPEKPAVPST